jgi:hypothetical protein
MKNYVDKAKTRWQNGNFRNFIGAQLSVISHTNFVSVISCKKFKMWKILLLLSFQCMQQK